MSELIKHRLSDLYCMSSGISSKPEQAGHGSPFCSFGTVFNNIILPDELPDLMDTSDAERVTYSIKEGDVFFTRTSETKDELAMSSVAIKDYPDATFSGFLKRLRPVTEGKVYPKFMAFFFRSSYFRKIIDNKTVMTLRASFNEDIFNDIEIEIPEYEEQVKIGDALYCIESIIRNNNSICVDLESMAKQIYDYWFVQFDFPDENGRPYKSSGGTMEWNDELKREIPVGWECTNLGSLIESNVKSTTQVGQVEAGTYPFFTSGLEVLSSSNNIVDGLNCYLSTGGNATIKYYDGKADYSTDTWSIKGIGSFNYMLPFVLLDLLPFMNKLFFTGTGLKHLQKDVFAQYCIAVPSDVKIIDDFASKIKSTILQKSQLQIENREFIELRDFLLPMLMNGQIKVGA